MYRDHLLRLDLETLTQLEVVKWKADDSTTIICTAKGQSEVFFCLYFDKQTLLILNVLAFPGQLLMHLYAVLSGHAANVKCVINYVTYGK